MSRRGGKRRQVLQLGNASSKLHLYGYSKNFQSGENAAKASSLNLLGAYSDSESEENAEEHESKEQLEDPAGEGPQASEIPTDEAEVCEEADEEAPNMDAELRNFLSEIEAISLHVETASNSKPASPSSNHHDEQRSQTSDHPSFVADLGGGNLTNPNSPVMDESGLPADSAVKTEPPKKKYSMFVKGDVQFVHSPSQEVASDGPSQEKVDDLDLPEEPTTSWQMVQDEATQYYYYWNWQTNSVTWEIPNDYTQYLLLHREYEEKLAKLSPAQLAAVKERKAGENAHSAESGNTSAIREANDSLTMQPDQRSMGDTIGPKTPKEPTHTAGDAENSLPHCSTAASEELHRKREKKKKSHKHKKHKKKHSDEEVDEDNDETKKSSKMSVAPESLGLPLIGPQLPIIVPYLSDNEDDDDDDEKNKDQDESVLTEKCEASSTAAELEHSQNSLSEKQGNSNLAEISVSSVHVQEDLVSAGADEVSHHAASPTENVNKQSQQIESTDGHESKEIDSLLEQQENDACDEDEQQIPESTAVSFQDVELSREDEKKWHDRKEDENYGQINDQSEISQDSFVMKAEDKLDKVDDSLEPKVEKVETKPPKTKKEVIIDMFSEDLPEISEERKDDIIKTEDKAILTPAADLEELVHDDDLTMDQVEEGEIPDTQDSTATLESKISLVPAHVSQVATTNQRTESSQSHSSGTVVEDSKVSSLLLTNIVGYGSDEEEEGEVKEDDEVLSSKPKESMRKESKGKSSESYGERKRDSRDEHAHHKSSKRTDDYRKSEGEKRKDEKSGNHVKSAKRSKSSRDEKTGKDSRSKMLRASTGKEKKDSHGKKAKMGEFSLDSGENASRKTRDMHSLETISDISKDESENINLKKASAEITNTDDVDDADIDFDDIDDIDRVLEMAMIKKMDQKKSTKEFEIHDASHNVVETPTVHERQDEASAVSKLTQEESADQKIELTDTTEQLLAKLEFLDISMDSFSKLQVLYIELKTRYTDWTAGELATSYFLTQLQQAEALLVQYELSGVPEGWARQWDRANQRYCYRNLQTNRIQWDYPEVDVRSSKKEKRANSSQSRGRESSKDGGDPEQSRKKQTVSSSSSRSSRHRKRDEKDRGKRERRGSSHHRRKKRRRHRDHSSSSNSSQGSGQYQHHHKSKRKKRSRRSEKSPSVEIVDGDEVVHVIMESPPPATLSPEPDPLLEKTSQQTSSEELKEIDTDPMSDETSQPLISSMNPSQAETPSNVPDVADDSWDIDGQVIEPTLVHGGPGTSADSEEDRMEEEENGEEEINSAVILKPPQIIHPPVPAALNTPAELYTSSAAYMSGYTPATEAAASTTSSGDINGEPMDEGEKGLKKKKKEKAAKDKSLTTGYSIMMKKKRVSSMVQKWQQVKKEVEKEDRDKELRQAAIRQKINELK